MPITAKFQRPTFLQPFPRVVCYHQTHYYNGQFVSILPLLTHGMGVTHIIVVTIHLNEAPGNITVNDNP